MMKKCTRCQEAKDNSKFGKRASSKDGLDSRCLDCIKECSKQSADKNRAQNKTIPLNKICPTCRIQKTANLFGTNPGNKDGLRNECKECRNLKTRIKYETDQSFRDNESIRAAQNYIENKEYILNRTKRWSKNNPDKKVEQRHRRHARLYGQIDFDLPKDFIKILREKQNNTCMYCSMGNVKLTVEHMLPLSRGGKHCFDNVIMACTTCNFSKHNKTVEEWLEHITKLLQAGVSSDILSVIVHNLSILVEEKKDAI